MTTAIQEPPPQSASLRVQWDAAMFYWARLEVPSTGRANRAGIVPAAGMQQFVDQVPVSIEEVHAVCVQVNGQAEPGSLGTRLIVCAVPRDQLDRLPPGTVSLTPGAFPRELGAEGLDPTAFNLLIGEFEPVAARQARARKRFAVAAVAGMLAGIVAIGSVRRANHAELVRTEARKSSAALLASLDMPRATLADLHAERSRLDMFARAVSGESPLSAGKDRPRDAAAELQQVLAAWPTPSSAKPQSISIGSEGVLLSVLVPGDAGAFVSALVVPDGWKLDEPSLAAVGLQTRVNLRMRPGLKRASTEGAPR
ncbi:MAG: hypothetical protein IT438_10805 [Phycisphaerales bacterium]|nr:hypothetical protein [Phycisphaerales bacterium]